MIKLVPIDQLKASSYNPRKNDEKRLKLTELSLQKLGFVLPIYADVSGEILSGHQRHLVASRMGFTEIPVEYVSSKELRERKAANVLFNRATNDLQKQDTCIAIKKKLYAMDIESMIADIPDIKPNTPESFPCVNAIHHVDVIKLAKQNHKAFDAHTKQLSKSLEHCIGKAMPIVISEDEEVINGIGRLQVAVEAKRKVVLCVTVSAAQKEFARAMLNLLSMDFDLESAFADELRYNAFRRERTSREQDSDGRETIGDGIYVGLFPKSKGRDFFNFSGKTLEIWKQHYGNCVVDFGAGKYTDTKVLRRAGITVSAFEPYFVTIGDKIHKAKSLELINKFLDEVESGMQYSTVFISSVFNSVPFIADRKQIAIIAAALCFPKGITVCWCQSNKSSQFIQTKRKMVSSQKRLMFDLDYEPNTTLGDFSRLPKVQKGHTREEMEEIFSPCFKTVNRLELIDRSWYMENADPMVDPSALAAALDFEFELPYPDGTRMGLSERARAAFEKRLSITLPDRAEKGGGEDGKD